MRIGDDVGAVTAGRGKLVVKVDMLVEGTDMPPGMSYRQAARKAVAMCVSDFAAKGVRPGWFLVSLGLKRGVSESQVEDLGKGLRDGERKWKVELVGGDTNEASELVIDCVMFGFAKKMVERRGAKPGDLVVVTGRFGSEKAGLMILGGGLKAPKRFRSQVVRKVMEPTPNLELGVAISRHLSSAMDSSDGLGRSLHTLAKASGVGFELDRMPDAPGVAGFAKVNRLDIRDLLFAGGEEYAIVGTVKESKLARAQRAARRAGGEVIAIGRVTSKVGEVRLNAGELAGEIPNEGWTHLS